MPARPISDGAGARSELDSAARGRQNPAMLYWLGKALELIGMVVTLLALMAGMGLTPSGQASMGHEFMLLGIGGGIFTLGWWLERGRSKG